MTHFHYGSFATKTVSLNKTDIKWCFQYVGHLVLGHWVKHIVGCVCWIEKRAFVRITWWSVMYILSRCLPCAAFTCPSKDNRGGFHYIDVIMTTVAYQITSFTVVYSTIYWDADQRKHQSSASLAFVWGIHRSGEFLAQRASYAENVSIWWRHHVHHSIRLSRPGWNHYQPGLVQLKVFLSNGHYPN